MQARSIRVLMLEDVDTDAVLCETELRRGAFAPTCHKVDSREAFEAAFGEGYAAVEFLRSSDGRGAYLLVPQPRREEPIDTDEA